MLLLSLQVFYRLISIHNKQLLSKQTYNKHLLSINKRSLLSYIDVVNHNKQSFTLIELSVVTVIISIMLTTILVSRSLIDYAKINKIQEEARMLNNSIQMFYNQYGCLPGDCTANQVTDLTKLGLNSLCTTNTPYVVCTDNTNGCPAATPLNTGSIETATKRTCMMYSLQLAGYINGVNTSYATLTDSIAGQNIPIAKFSRQAAWDFRVLTPQSTTNAGLQNPVSNMITLPSEVSYIINGYGNDLFLLLEKAQYITGPTADMALIQSAISGGAQYIISSKLAYKLDNKFDDGLPYSGNIISGLDVIDVINSNSGTNTSCNLLALMPASPFDVTPYNKYLQSNAISSGCLTGYVILVS